MKQFTYFTVLLLLCPLLKAQNYQLFYSDRKALFADEYGIIKSITFDSATYRGDSIFYPGRTIRQLDYNCFTPFGAPWTGGVITLQNDGTHIFRNRRASPVIIHSRAGLNHPWIMYDDSSTIRIMAQVTSTDTLHVFGLIDSVKTIGISVFDQLMNPVENPFNTEEIVISQHFGVIKMINLYHFPELPGEYEYWETSKEFRLAGLSDPGAGMQNLTWFRVFDFEPGDEIHTLLEESTWDFNYSVSREVRTIKKFLERTDYPDSIVYTLELKESTHRRTNDSISSVFLHDTIRQVIRSHPEFDRWPGETILSEQEAYSTYMDAGPPVTKTIPPMGGRIWPGYDTCWSNCCVDGCFQEFTYIEGLGGPYGKCSNAFSGGGMEKKLVYYRKGGETWGIPYVNLGKDPRYGSVAIQLYPNPASEIICVKVRSDLLPCQLFLLDVQGRLILDRILNSGLTEIPVSLPARGLYFYRIINKSGHPETGSLILQ